MPDVINLKKQETAEVKKTEAETQAPVSHVIEPQLVKYEADTIYHEWEAPEFIYYKKNRTWFTYVVCLSLIAVFISIFTGSNLTALIFGLIGVIILTTASNEPRTIQFAISPLGVSCGDKHYPFDDIESFWIHYNQDVQEISLKSKKLLSSYVKIPLGGQDPLFIRNMLVSYLSEAKQEEEITDLLMRKIKF